MSHQVVASLRGVSHVGAPPTQRVQDHRGHLIAIDIRTGEVLWRHSMETRPRGATLTMGGGLW